MQQAQIVVYRIEEVLAESLRQLAQIHRFRLREISQFSSCSNLINTSQPLVLIMRLSSQLERELALLVQVHACQPKTVIIAIIEAENPVLTGLVWELGATLVLTPSMPTEIIAEVILSVLKEGVAPK